MNKNFFLMLLIFILVYACGKKGDPVFEKKKSQLKKTQIIKVI